MFQVNFKNFWTEAGLHLLAFAVLIVLLTLGVVFGLPWLWELVKPFLHSITA